MMQMEWQKAQTMLRQLFYLDILFCLGLSVLNLEEMMVNNSEDLLNLHILYFLQ